MKIKSGIQNLIEWFPIIWKDRQWDQSFLFNIMIKKLSLMEEYFKESNDLMDEDKNDIVEKINDCKIALEKLDSEEYERLGFSEYYEKYPMPESSNFLAYINRERTDEDNVLYKKCWELSNKLEKQYFNNFVKNFKYYRKWWD